MAISFTYFHIDTYKNYFRVLHFFYSALQIKIEIPLPLILCHLWIYKIQNLCGFVNFWVELSLYMSDLYICLNESHSKDCRMFFISWSKNWRMFFISWSNGSRCTFSTFTFLRAQSMISLEYPVTCSFLYSFLLSNS